MEYTTEEMPMMPDRNYPLADALQSGPNTSTRPAADHHDALMMMVAIILFGLILIL
jgi:hypothetical protein